MSKEEILAEEINNVYPNVSVEHIKSAMIKGNGVSESALEAMEIYARQESDKKAVAFKDWCDEYISTFIGSDELEPKLKKTTEQLLEIFNNSTK